MTCSTSHDTSLNGFTAKMLQAQFLFQNALNKQVSNDKKAKNKGPAAPTKEEKAAEAAEARAGSANRVAAFEKVIAVEDTMNDTPWPQPEKKKAMQSHQVLSDSEASEAPTPCPQTATDSKASESKQKTSIVKKTECFERWLKKLNSPIPRSCNQSQNPKGRQRSSQSQDLWLTLKHCSSCLRLMNPNLTQTITWMIPPQLQSQQKLASGPKIMQRLVILHALCS